MPEANSIERQQLGLLLQSAITENSGEAGVSAPLAAEIASRLGYSNASSEGLLRDVLKALERATSTHERMISCLERDALSREVAAGVEKDRLEARAKNLKVAGVVFSAPPFILVINTLMKLLMQQQGG